MIHPHRPARRLPPQRRQRPRPRPAALRKDALSPRERVELLRLLASGAIFVLLVAAKLLLPGRMDGVGKALGQTLRRSVDVTAVFSAVGDFFSKETPPEGALGDLYQAVFQPDPDTGAAPTKAAAPQQSGQPPLALSQLRHWGEGGMLREVSPVPSAAGAEETDPVSSSMDRVLYSDEELPENVSMRQMILGFDHKTPVVGAISSGFGYRDHPTEGTERFHYGIDLAADTGTAIACFADGVVTAVGQSSSYGKYCTVTHAGGCTTLYAHCSQISVSPGDTVKRGQALGEVGQTGMATGPHLHFEVQKDGVYLNPIYYVETA